MPGRAVNANRYTFRDFLFEVGCLGPFSPISDYKQILRETPLKVRQTRAGQFVCGMIHGREVEDRQVQGWYALKHRKFRLLESVTVLERELEKLSKTDPERPGLHGFVVGRQLEQIRKALLAEAAEAKRRSK